MLVNQKAHGSLDYSMVKLQNKKNTEEMCGRLLIRLQNIYKYCTDRSQDKLERMVQAIITGLLLGTIVAFIWHWAKTL
jgi:hypothetical protein